MTEKTQRRGHRHRPRRRGTVFRIILGIWVLVALVILAAIMFAPRRSPRPPSSEITYQVPPEKWVAPELEPYGSEKSAAHPAPGTAKRIREHEQDGKGKYRIFGFVTDRTTDEGIMGARVRATYVLTDEEKAHVESLRDKAATDASAVDMFLDTENELTRQRVEGSAWTEGKYEIRVSKPGEYRLWAGVNGYISTVNEVVVVVNDGWPEVRHDFALSPGARVSGTVYEAGTGRGASGVYVFDNQQQYRTVTDENGEYMLSGLTLGDVVVSLDLDGTAYHASGRVPSERVSIEYEDDHVRAVDFEVEPAGIVWGFVLGPDREAVPNAGVMLVTSESIASQVIKAGIKQNPPIYDDSDAEGYYELFGVPLEKEWRLAMMDDEWAPQLTDRFMLTPAARSVRIDIYTVPGSDVYGRVTDTERNPLDNIDVACLPAYANFFSPLDSKAFRDSKTNHDGTFVIENLPRGEYQILAFSDEFRISVIGEPVYPDGYSDIHGVEIVLEAIDAGRFSVFGYVRDERDRPVQGAHIELVNMSATMSPGALETMSDGQGYFEIAGVDPGFMMLNAKKEGFSSVTVSNVLLDEETVIVMKAASIVSGRVIVRETGRPPDHYSVRAIPKSSKGGRDFFAMAENAGGRGFSDENGDFEMELAAGSYTLEARSKNLTPGTTDIDLAPAQRLDNVTIYVSREGGTIRGRVRTKDGRSPAGAVVRVAGAGAAGELSFVSVVEQFEQKGIAVQRDGRFEFEDLAAGTYTVSAEAPGYARGKSGPIKLRHGQTVSGITVELGSGGSLEGYVVIDGELKSGAPVTLVGNGVSKVATTDNNGQYKIEGIPAGSYLGTAVSLEGDGLAGMFAPLHARIEIFEGRTTVHNFGEETGASIVGVCSPGPKFGTIGYAIMRLPGPSSRMAGVNFANPVSWFAEDSTTANQVVSMSKVATDGFFKLDNVPSGTFQLEVYYMSFGEVLGGGGRAGYSSPITVSDEEIIDVHELKVEVR